MNDSVYKTSSIYEDNQYFGKSQFLELYSSLHLSKSLTLLTGMDYRYHSYSQDYFSVSIYGPYKSKFRDTSLNQKAMYASMMYSSPDKKLTIELGGRYNEHSRYGNNSTFTFNPAYQINNTYRVFGSISSGFKAHSLYQLSINDQLEAKKSINYEGGVSLQTKKVNSRFVFFNRRINNGIDYNYISYKYFNYIQQTVNGIEWEMTIRPTDKLNLTANYTYLSREEITQNRVTTKDTVSYDYLLRRPKHSINLTAGFEWVKGLYTSLTGKYVSKRYYVGGYKKADVSLDSYILLSDNAAYTLNSRVRFVADVQNLFN